MRVRCGFVSNSSSSSFVLAVPKQKLSIGEVIDWYGITDKYGQEAQSYLAIKIWDFLHRKKYSDASEYFASELDEDNIRWRRETGYGDHDDSYYDAIRRNMTEYSDHMIIEVSNSGDTYDYDYDAIKLPWDAESMLDDLSTVLLTKPEVGFGINQH